MNHAGGKHFVKQRGGNGEQSTVLQIYNEYGYDYAFTVFPMPEQYYSSIYNQFTVPFNYTFLIRASFFNPDPHTVTLRFFDEDNNLILEEISHQQTGNIELQLYFTPSAILLTPLMYIVISFI